MVQQLTMFGRIVWGHPGKPRPKMNNNVKPPVPVIKDGQPVQQWSFGLAVEKAAHMQARGASQQEIAAQSFEYSVWPFFEAEAKTGFPNGVPPDFSWKFKDGDGIDKQGKPYADREGHKGHYIIAISTEAFAPNLFRQDGRGGYIALKPEELKTGDFVSVAVNLRLNIPTDRTHKPGLFVNPNGICFAFHGSEIVSGPDAQTMFGGQPQYAMPPGASTAPMMPQGGAAMPGTGMPPGAGQMPGTGMPPMQQPQGGYGQPQPGLMPGMMPPR